MFNYYKFKQNNSEINKNLPQLNLNQKNKSIIKTRKRPSSSLAYRIIHDGEKKELNNLITIKQKLNKESQTLKKNSLIDQTNENFKNYYKENRYNVTNKNKNNDLQIFTQNKINTLSRPKTISDFISPTKFNQQQINFNNNLSRPQSTIPTSTKNGFFYEFDEKTKNSRPQSSSTTNFNNFEQNDILINNVVNKTIKDYTKNKETIDNYKFFKNHVPQNKNFDCNEKFLNEYNKELKEAFLQQSVQEKNNVDAKNFIENKIKRNKIMKMFKTQKQRNFLKRVLSGEPSLITQLKNNLNEFNLDFTDENFDENNFKNDELSFINNNIENNNFNFSGTNNFNNNENNFISFEDTKEKINTSKRFQSAPRGGRNSTMSSTISKISTKKKPKQMQVYRNKYEYEENLKYGTAEKELKEIDEFEKRLKGFKK